MPVVMVVHLPVDTTEEVIAGVQSLLEQTYPEIGTPDRIPQEREDGTPVLALVWPMPKENW